MWQEKSAQQYEALRALGITAAKVAANRSVESEASATQRSFAILRAGLGIYVENIATDFYSAYHRWFPGHHENWRFLELKKTLTEHPADRSVFVREPSLSDPAAFAPIKARLGATVRDYTPFRPLFFNLGDEPGIADLSAAWDFDFSAPSLSKMRVWLQGRYGTLAALNREWSTRFRRWDDVVPSTTTEAMTRTDDNFASWSDFKAWMDVAFAEAVRRGTAAVHEGAPWARSGIEGIQLPGWGGYDYSRLATSVDVMEFYDLDRDIELMRSFNPQLILLTTPTWYRPDASHIYWSEFLRGIRGMMIWDPRDEFLSPDGTAGAQSRAAVAFFTEMHKGLGARLLQGSRHYDPIAILYSPVSFRVRWMLDHRTLGPSWITRSAGTENEDNAVRAAGRRALSLSEELGFSPRYISDDAIAQGALRKEGYRIAILPQALALSPGAAKAIEEFVRAGGTVAVDGDVGLFDDHGKRLRRPLLSHALASGSSRVAHLPPDYGAALALLGRKVKECDLAPDVTLTTEGGEPVADVKQYVFHTKDAMFVALLAETGAGGADRKVSVAFKLRRAAPAFDARSGSPLGSSGRLEVDVPSNAPTVLRIDERYSRP